MSIDWNPTPWWERPFLAVDLETTGTDWTADRIVQVAVAQVEPDGRCLSSWSTLVDPGIDIPEAATNIHGITTEQVRAEGEPTASAVDVVSYLLWHAGTNAEHHPEGLPVVMFNAVFDWPFLLAESARHQVAFPCGIPILDPYIVDGMISRRRGSRKLVDQCAHYGIDLDGEAHDATVDALAAARLMRKLVDEHPALKDHTLASLLLRQAKGAEQRRASYVDYRRREGDASFDTHAGWPIPAGVSA